jgi:hypothetical protein
MGMMLNFDDLSYAPRWYDYETGEVVEDGELEERLKAHDESVEATYLKIRPYPSSKSDLVIKDGGVILAGSEQFKVFAFCLMDWWVIRGADGKPVPVNDKTKRKVFDFRMGGIPKFVLDKTRLFDEEKEEEEKN